LPRVGKLKNHFLKLKRGRRRQWLLPTLGWPTYGPLQLSLAAATIFVPVSQTASFGSVAPNRVRLNRIGSAPLQFAVGLKLKSKAEHVMVDAEDALIAALKVKAERPEALIMYVRRQNRRGDARNPPRKRDS
jgi:hypothetical protein